MGCGSCGFRRTKGSGSSLRHVRFDDAAADPSLPKLKMSSRSMNMNRPRAANAGSAATTGRADGSETLSGFAVSLLFWFSLLIAAAAFAAVGLSPKLLEQARLSSEYATNQHRLVQIEHQNEQLQRVIDAIQNDPEFAAEMTRVEFDAVRSGEEIIPVEAGLRLEPRGLENIASRPAAARIWYRPLVAPFAENDSLRRGLLGAASILIIVSFTWFQPATAGQLGRSVAAGRNLWRAVCSRYVRPV